MQLCSVACLITLHTDCSWQFTAKHRIQREHRAASHGTRDALPDSARIGIHTRRLGDDFEVLGSVCRPAIADPYYHMHDHGRVRVPTPVQVRERPSAVEDCDELLPEDRQGGRALGGPRILLVQVSDVNYLLDAL